MNRETGRQESGPGGPETAGGSRFLRLLTPVALLAGGVLAVSLFPGCGKPPPPPPDGKDPKAAKMDPWGTVRTRLKKDADAAAVKTAIAALNGDLISFPEAPRPPALTREAEDALAALVPLNPEDRAEIRGSTFTPHDPVYVAECLYLRDAARSLDVPPRPGQTPEQHAAERADLGFAWVCRQVYLNPWLIPIPGQPGFQQAASLPPTFVLRRGYGSGLERAYVFLALLQQMGLDGCLVGPDDAGKQGSGFVAYGPDMKTVLTGTPRGPFWAVGVRVGADVRLYDPWRGQPFPAALGALKANPDAHKAWFEDKANASGVTAGDAKKATVFLAVPVNALAPRVAMLEQQLKADVGVELAVDPAALRNAFPDPKPAFWNPPGDDFAYGRTARTFLPVDFGGGDRTPRGRDRLFESYLRAQVAEAAFAPPAELANNPEAAERIRGAILAIYGAAFLGLKPPDLVELMPNPRERIQRGQFQDAARDLVTKQGQFSQGLERLRNNRDAEQQIRQWAEAARDLYDRQGLAQTPEAREAAKAAVNDHWQRNAGAVQLLVDRMSAEVGQAEATLLLALCKHEQAERAQARLERATGAEAGRLKAEAGNAWEAASGEWQTYAEWARAQAGFAGRADHVKALAARAEKMKAASEK